MGLSTSPSFTDLSFAESGSSDSDPPDVEPFHRWLSDDGSEWLLFHKYANGDYLLRFPGFADFRVNRSGTKACAKAMEHVHRDLIEHLYLNQVRPLMLAHQGNLVLHGSAVVQHGRAMAFVGASGDGKSTLATYLALQGSPLVSDDGLTVETNGDQAMVLPGHRSVRLWPDSLQEVLGNDGERILPVPYSSKARIANDQRIVHTSEPSPLQALMLLDGHEEDGPVALHLLSPTDALMSLLAHAFLLDHRQPAQIERQFEQMATLVKQVPVYRMYYPRRYDRLAQVRNALLELQTAKGVSA